MRETQLKAIKRGSRVFRKTLTKQEDFLTDAKVERWREKVRDQTLTKEEIKKVYLLTNSGKITIHAPKLYFQQKVHGFMKCLQ